MLRGFGCVRFFYEYGVKVVLEACLLLFGRASGGLFAEPLLQVPPPNQLNPPKTKKK